MLVWPTLASAETELTLWHSYRGAERDALDRIVSNWNASHPETPVETLAVPYEAFAQKLTASIPRGQGPDLFIHAHDRIGDWADSGLIAPIEADSHASTLEPFMPVTRRALRYDDELWGWPLAFKSVALFYNRELVDEPPETTDELLAMARRLSENDSNVYGLAYQADSFYYHAPWLFGFGGGIFTSKGEVRLDRPENARSLAFAANLQDEDIVPEEPTYAVVKNLFNSGRAATTIQGPWFLGSIDESIDYGVAPLPTVSETDQRATPFLTVDAAIVSKRSEHPEAARRFARHLATGEAARTRLEVGRQLVALSEVYGESGPELSETMQAFRRQADHARPMPNQPAMRSVPEPFARGLRSVLRGDTTPKRAVERAQRDFETVTRPPPDEKEPTGYLLGFGLLLLAATGWIVYRVRRQGGMSALRGAKTAYAYVAPGATALVVLVFVPFLVGTAVAFFAHEGGEFTFVGLSNFFSILASTDYPVTDPLSFYFTLVVTVVWTVVNVALHVGIGLAVALVLRNTWIRGRGIWRVLLIVPWAVPNYITALIWKGMFHTQFGAINGLLEFLGLEPIPWFSNFWTAFAANVTTNTWLGFPFMMVVSLGALQAIPEELEEAARMDGAGWWTRFRHVVWPQIKPALVPAVILGSVWTFNMFNIIYLVSEGAPGGSTEILISEAYKWAFSRQEQYGYAAAYATLIFMVLVGYSALTEQFTGRLEDIEQ
jgi:arabinogalactan oligomer/maltooligosaccharide transport system permease protein